MSDPTRTVDIAIVGDGLVGRPLAIALAARGWRVALIDRAPLARPLPSDPLDERCTALAASSIDWLTREGLWYPEGAAAETIRRVHVSQRGHFGATRLTPDDVPARGGSGRGSGGGSGRVHGGLGATIENRHFLATLRAPLATAIGRGRVLSLATRVPTALETAAASVRVQLGPAAESRPEPEPEPEPGQGSASTTTIDARLLIAADGSESALRTLAGIATTRTDYAQSALLTTVQLDRSADGLAIERFTEDGPFALLPRPGGRMNLVLCAPPERAARLRGAPPEAFLAEIAARTPRRLGRWRAVGPRVAVPLLRIEAGEERAGRVLLLGNAARLLHPVAGQGYNLALRDVAALLRRLQGGPANVADPGAASLLDDLIAAREADRRRTVRLTDALARGFRGRSRLLGQARAAGLLTLDAVGPARRGFAALATGGGGPGASG